MTNFTDVREALPENGKRFSVLCLLNN